MTARTAKPEPLPGDPGDALPGLETDEAPVLTDAAPKRGRGRPPGVKNGQGAAKKPQWARAAAVEKYLNEIVSLAGTALIFVNPEDSRIILEGGPRIVHELVELAKSEPALRRYLEMSAAPGKYGPLTVAVAAVLIPIAVNHNLIPSVGMFGAASTRQGGE